MQRVHGHTHEAEREETGIHYEVLQGVVITRKLGAMDAVLTARLPSSNCEHNLCPHCTRLSKYFLIYV